MKRLLAILLALVMILPAWARPSHVHAAGETYAMCNICQGTGVCELCDPRMGADHLGNGYMACTFCDSAGYRRCGTNTTGDGTPIGCDGSGHKADGSVCEVCGGTGKYLCDVCGGAHTFECNCRQAGTPGVCLLCKGSGWRRVDSQCNPIETGYAVYPKDGDTLDGGAWGRHEYFTYHGGQETAAEFVASKGGTSGADFWTILRTGSAGGSGSSGSGSSGSGGSQSGNSQSGSSGGSQSGGQSGGDPQPDDRDDPPQDGDDLPQESRSESRGRYTAPVPSAEEVVRKLAEARDDMIYLLCRQVDGEHLLSVQIVLSELNADELQKLQSLSEADIQSLKDELEKAANGFRFGAFDVSGAFDGAAAPVTFRFGDARMLPVVCDILLELPDGYQPAEQRIYLMRDGEAGELPLRAVDRFSEASFLIFGSDRLGDFAFTDGEPVKRMTDGKDWPPIVDPAAHGTLEAPEENAQGDSQESGQPADPKEDDRPNAEAPDKEGADPGRESTVTIGASDPAPAEQSGGQALIAKRGSPVPYVVIGVLAAAVAALAILLVRKKKE